MTSAPSPASERVHELFREAAEWRLIGLLFECPGEDWRKQVAEVSAEIADPDLGAAAAAALAEGREALYHSTFGPGGPAPPREASYQDSLQLGYLLSELQGYYDAFAFAPRTNEPGDHVAVEAGFVAYLRLKEAYAVACGDQENAAVAAEAARGFTERHVAILAQPLAAALRNSGARYLSLAAEALLRRTGPPPAAPLRLPVLPGEDEGCAFGDEADYL